MSNNPFKSLESSKIKQNKISKKHLEIEYFRIIEDTNLKNKSMFGYDKAKREIGIIPIYQGFLSRNRPWGRTNIVLNREISQKKDVKVANLNCGYFNFNNFFLEFKIDFFKNKKILEDNYLSTKERINNHTIQKNIKKNEDGIANIEPVNDFDFDYYNLLFDKVDEFVNEFQKHLDSSARTSLHRNMMPVLVKYNDKFFLNFTFKLFIISERNHYNFSVVNNDIVESFQNFFTTTKLKEYSIATVSKPFTGTGMFQRVNYSILNECMIYDDLLLDNKDNFFRLKTTEERNNFFQKIFLTEAQLFGHLSAYSRTELIGSGKGFSEWTNCQHFSVSFEIKNITNEPSFKNKLESLSFYLNLLKDVKE